MFLLSSPVSIVGTRIPPNSAVDLEIAGRRPAVGPAAKPSHIIYVLIYCYYVLL